MRPSYEEARAAVFAGRTASQVRRDWEVQALIHGWTYNARGALERVGAGGLGYETRLVNELHQAPEIQPRRGIDLQLAKRLRAAREAAGFTACAVSRRLGLHRHAMLLVEAGHRRIQVHELVRLASLYRTTLNALVLGEEDASG